MRDRENRRSKLYTGLLLLGLFCFLLCSVCLPNHMLEKVLRFQKNMIGILQEQDASHVQVYLHAMFENVTDTSVEKGENVLEQHGYTDAGIRFLGQNMGIQESVNLFVFFYVLLIVGVVFCFYRIMQIQKKELNLLRQENERLRENQMREEYVLNQNKRMQSFIENIAHQIKTPLSRVFTSLDIVEDYIDDNEAKQHVEECYQHLDSMNALTRRLMDIGRLEAGKIIFQKNVMNLTDVLEEIKESFHTEKSRIQIDSQNSMEFYGDEKWLNEAISNILVNAIEADQTKGDVQIFCVKNEDYIKISIRDHGPGLSEKDIPNIFDRFYLPDNVKKNHTGIGLNLAKLIIEGHQGSLYVYNHLEGGAVFQIILPIYESLKVRK